MTTEISRIALALHNKFRVHHNSPPLTWSPELEREAQQHAATLLNTNGGTLAPKRGANVGQNVFQLRKLGHDLEPLDDLCAVERAIENWYEDLKDYDPSNPGVKGRSFSQLVWPTTRSLGVGIARKQTPGSLNIIVIAFYDPPASYDITLPDTSVQPLPTSNKTLQPPRPLLQSDQMNFIDSYSSKLGTNGLTPYNSRSSREMTLEISQKNASESNSKSMQLQNSQQMAGQVSTNQKEATRKIMIQEENKPSLTFDRERKQGRNEQNFVNPAPPPSHEISETPVQHRNWTQPQKQSQPEIQTQQIHIKKENAVNEQRQFASANSTPPPKEPSQILVPQPSAPVSIKIERLDEKQVGNTQQQSHYQLQQEQQQQQYKQQQQYEQRQQQQYQQQQNQLVDRPIQIVREQQRESLNNFTNFGSNQLSQQDQQQQQSFNERSTSFEEQSSSSMMTKRSWMTSMSSQQFYEEHGSSQMHQQYQM